MKRILFLISLAIVTSASAQNEYEITVESKQPSGIIDEMLYGQLFEHIYFSANNGVWPLWGIADEPTSPALIFCLKYSIET